MQRTHFVGGVRAAVCEVDAVVTVEVVVLDGVVAMGHAIDGRGVIYTLDGHEYRPTVPGPLAAVSLFHHGGIGGGEGLAVGVIFAAVPLLPPGQ